jgi:hypothetical protein
MSRVILLLSVVFKGWAFIDALWRRAPSHWYWIIFFVPFGGLAYLLLYRLRQPGRMRQVGEQMLESIKRPPSVELLRKEYADSPSHSNRVRLAQGLFDAGQLGEARTLFELVVSARADDRDGLYGLGRICIEQGEFEDAIEPLRKLIELHRGYRDFAAWPYLAHVLNELGRTEECQALFEELVAVAPRAPHRVLLAEYLIGAGQPSRGRDLLRDVIEEHDRSPGHVKRQYRASIRKARRLLRGL